MMHIFASQGQGPMSLLHDRTRSVPLALVSTVLELGLSPKSRRPIVVAVLPLIVSLFGHLAEGFPA